MKRTVVLLAMTIWMEGCGDASSNSANEIASSNPSCTKCEYGSLTDDRDGQIYRTVKIGSQVWMAENLNYAYTQRTAELDSSSTCIENKPDYCKKYGRFYLWSAAMDSVGLFSSNAIGCGYEEHIVNCPVEGVIRGVCPKGWHLPSRMEWELLFNAVGGRVSEDGDGKFMNDAASELVKPSEYGFDAIPVGWLTACGKNEYSLTCNIAIAWSDRNYFYKDLESDYDAATFWSSSYRKGTLLYPYPQDIVVAHMRPFDDRSGFGDGHGHMFMPVRCVKD